LAIDNDGFENSENISKDYNNIYCKAAIASNIPELIKQHQISFETIRVNKENVIDTLNKVATAINTRLYQGNDEIPFFNPIDFQNWKNNKKIILYGSNGCGKSRSIVETLRNKIHNIRNIYVINSQNPVRRESTITSLDYFLLDISDEDVVIWDNFPIDIFKYSALQNSIEKFAILNSRTDNFLVSICSDYLSLYQILSEHPFNLPMQKIIYNDEVFENIIKSLGINLMQFKEIYNKYIDKDIKTVLKVIKEKEGTPRTILLYYQFLIDVLQNSNKKDVYIGKINEEFLEPLNYFNIRFKDLIDHNPIAVEFLNVINLCYDLGLKRNLDMLYDIQTKLFGSTCSNECLKKLDNWIYTFPITDHYYLDEISRKVIKNSLKEKKNILPYLASEGFFNIATYDKITSYSFGIFLGKHIQHVNGNSINVFNYFEFVNHIKQNNYFSMGFGISAGINFHLFQKDLQEKILNLAKENDTFALNFGEGIGNIFHLLSYEYQKRLILMALENKNVALGLGIGFKYSLLDKDLQKKILLLIEKRKLFAKGVGIGLWHNFSLLKEGEQIKMIEMAEKRDEFASKFGIVISAHYLSLNENIKKQIWALVEKSNKFAEKLIYGLCCIYPILDEGTTKNIWEIAEKKKNNSYTFNYLARGLTTIFYSLKFEEQIKILDMVKNSLTVASEIGESIGDKFHLVSNKMLQDKILEILSKDLFIFGPYFASGVSKNFRLLNYKHQKQILEMAEENSFFRKELFYGLGKNLPFLNEDIQKKVWQIVDNEGNYSSLKFWLSWKLAINFYLLKNQDQLDILDKAECDENIAKGIAYGLGYNFYLIKEPIIIEKIFKLVESNKNFSSEFAKNLGYNFLYIKEDLQERILEMAAIELNKKVYDHSDNFFKDLCKDFSYLNQKIKKKLLKLVQENSEFAYRFGNKMPEFINEMGSSLQKEMIDIVKENTDFAKGFGYSIGYKFAFSNKELQIKILDMVKINQKFDSNFGTTLGYNFSYIRKDFQERILEMAQEDKEFGDAFFNSIGSRFSLFVKIFKKRFLEGQIEIVQLPSNYLKVCLGIFHHLIKLNKKEFLIVLIEIIILQS